MIEYKEHMAFFYGFKAIERVINTILKGFDRSWGRSF
jgi:hypothetical protein